jgi:hypothetical protein
MTTSDESITTMSRRVVEQCGELADMDYNLLQQIEERQSGTGVADTTPPADNDVAKLEELREKALSLWHKTFRLSKKGGQNGKKKMEA